MRNSIDDKLIDEVARLWVENGGDYDGFLFCSQQIKERIVEIYYEKLADDSYLA